MHNISQTLGKFTEEGSKYEIKVFLTYQDNAESNFHVTDTSLERKSPEDLDRMLNPHRTIKYFKVKNMVLEIKGLKKPVIDSIIKTLEKDPTFSDEQAEELRQNRSYAMLVGSNFSTHLSPVNISSKEEKEVLWNKIWEALSNMNIQLNSQSKNRIKELTQKGVAYMDGDVGLGV